VRWGATWLLVVALVGGAVIALELFVRARGYQPSVKDDEYAWAWERTSAGTSPRTVAILGTSRIQLAFSPQAFREALPEWSYVQLAINGTMPMGSLYDLARDPEFRGIAIVDSPEDGFLSTNLTRQDAYLEAYHRRWRAPGAMIERWLATEMQSRLALVSAAGMRALRSLFEGHGWPDPPYVTTYPDRTKFADFALADSTTRRELRVDRIAQTLEPATEAGATAWIEEALLHEHAVAMIQARGGNVVYVRMPTCDERWAADEVWRPKATFWDQFAARTRALTIHFRDVPALASLECPDTSHIASRDGPRFTRTVIDVLRARGVFAR
jgi:hypothetical protein